jgi:predicted membrane protein
VRNQGQPLVVIGVLIILASLALLIGNLLDIDMGVLCLPVFLILAGIWLLARPYVVSPETALRFRVFGPIRRVGSWTVTDEEIYYLLGDAKFDLTEAEIPAGETVIRVYYLLGDIKMWVPEDVGVSISSMAVITEARLFGEKREGFFSHVELASEEYKTFERRVRLEVVCFIADIRARLE